MANELLFFMEVLVGGLLAGTMYSLVALGFVLIFKASATFNLQTFIFFSLFGFWHYVIFLGAGKPNKVAVTWLKA